MNNPLNEVITLPEANKRISLYDQNTYDRRYSSFVTCCFEKSYNFWDRIGDRIASFFPELIRIHQVDFVRILDRLELKGFENKHLNWLIQFKENEYKELNLYRRNFVHYYQFESYFRYQHAMNLSDFDSLSKLWLEKYGFAAYFKKHLRLSSEGYFHMCKFLEDY